VEENKNKIHILQIVNSLEIGGLEKVVIHLVNNNPAESDIRFSIACLELKGALSFNVKPGISIYELDKNNYTYLHIIWKLTRLIIQTKVRIIHCHNYAPLFFGSIVKILLLGRIKLVYTEHNQIYSITPRHYRIFRYLIRFADKTICVSKDLQDYFYKKEIDRNAVVVWNGIPFPQVDQEKQIKLYREFHSKPETIIVGTAVVMSEQKGLIYLINAAADLIRKYSNIKFLMIGDGPLKNQLMDEADNLNIQDNFNFIGYKKDIANYLGVLDIFVLPSLWEGFSIVLLEASALGLPIIATDVGGNSEIIQDNHNGMIIQSKDIPSLIKAIETLYLDAGLRQKLSLNAKSSFKEKFTIDSMVNGYKVIYHQCIKK
jgi:glycosyltransferase involved in cell wall biosynthesis